MINGELMTNGELTVDDRRRSRRSQRWDELPTRSKVLVVLLTAVQVSLAVSAWIDLAQRPAEQVNGSKGRWAAVIAVNFIGPMLYFTRGRRARSVR